MAVAVSSQRITIVPAAGMGYLQVDGEQLYFRTHRPDGPARCAVLMLGPWGSERAYAYATWTRWGRRLARHGFAALQFDYRGMGESTGDSRLMGLDDFIHDARACMEALRRLVPNVPLILHGLRFGSVVARQRAMEQSVGGMLLWDPPVHAPDALKDVLRYRVAEDAVREEGGHPRAAGVDSLLNRLEAGESVIAEGHWLSARLRNDLEHVRDDRPATPVHSIRLATRSTRQSDGGETVVISSPPFWRPGRRLVPDLEELFQKSLAWIDSLAGEVRP